MVFLIQRVGPYHHARLRALAARRSEPFVVIEYRTTETEYVWSDVCDDGAYPRRKVKGDAALLDALGELSPSVVVCVGYSDPEIHRAVDWALRRGVTLLTCSDSTYLDERRTWAKEAGKRRLLAAFDAALVAGQRARKYLGHLGVPTERCFQPWDVVDNEHFADGARTARANAAVLRRSHGLPARFFLCVARFVPKKNVERLIAAFAAFAATTQRETWGLVLAGAGPLEGALRAQVAAAGLEKRVVFAGLVGYAELPVFYGLAEGFVMPSLSDQWGLVVNEAMAAGLPVLVSSRCGCVPDLVCEGENGSTFDPENADELASRMLQLCAFDDGRRREMGRRSAEIVADFSPEAFAVGLEDAIACAVGKRSRGKGLITPLAVRLLTALAK